MSVQLDDVFDEPPGVVAVVLSHAIEEAGWRLVSVSETGDEVVWEVDDPERGRTRLRASIVAEGGGARVSVASLEQPGAERSLGQGHTADVIPLRPHLDGGAGGAPFGPPSGPPPFGPV